MNLAGKKRISQEKAQNFKTRNITHRITSNVRDLVVPGGASLGSGAAGRRRLGELEEPRLAAYPCDTSTRSGQTCTLAAASVRPTQFILGRQES